MGKRLDQLGLGDDGPGEEQANAAVRELKRLSVAAFRMVNKIDSMLLDPDFQFARDTLEDIQRTIQRTDAVTEGQERAVDNIWEGGLRHGQAHRGWDRHERRTGRRY